MQKPITKVEEYIPGNLKFGYIPAGVIEEWTGPDQTGHCKALVRFEDGDEIVIQPGDFVVTTVIRK